MTPPCQRRSILHVFMLVCLRLTNAETDGSGQTTTEQTPTTDGGAYGQTQTTPTAAPWAPTTPAPGGLTTESQSGLDATSGGASSSSSSEVTTGDPNSTATTNQTEAPVTGQTTSEPPSPPSDGPVVLPDGRTEGTCRVCAHQKPYPCSAPWLELLKSPLLSFQCASVISAQACVTLAAAVMSWTVLSLT